MTKDQQHPQYNRDRPIIENLLQGEPSDLNLAELARLRVRYDDFPGARDLKASLDTILLNWNLTEEQLFERTRAIHNAGGIYKSRGKREEQDWN
jgi:Protein of unknown function (DUF3288)